MYFFFYILVCLTVLKIIIIIIMQVVKKKNSWLRTQKEVVYWIQTSILSINAHLQFIKFLLILEFWSKS